MITSSEMVEAMKKIAQLDVELTVEERNFDQHIFVFDTDEFKDKV